MYTVIDSDNYAASGIETLFFPGGEPHAKVPKFDGPVLFVAKCRTWNDVGLAACVDTILRVRTPYYKLFLPYAPGARQDKHEPRTDLIVADLFGGYHDSINRGSVNFFDLHSRLSAGFYSGINWMPRDLALPRLSDVRGIIAPDQGAHWRAQQFARDYPRARLIQCTKERNPQTGALSNYRFPEGEYPPGRYVVVDDICDGGGTFNLLADAFSRSVGYRERPWYTLELFVSHGIFSKGITNISPLYSRIYTTDSWFRRQTFTDQTAEHLTVFPLKPLYDEIMKEYAGA